MGLVRTAIGAAWITQGLVSRQFRCRCTGPGTGVTPRRVPMLDVLYVGLTIVVFAVLYLIVKGVERFER
jgi:hypothetical protein